MGNYIPNTEAVREEMLKATGFSSIREIYKNVPDSVWRDSVDLPAGKSELEVTEEIAAIANKNVQYKSCFRGAGAYRHFIPAAVSAIAAKEEFVTAYTPYQAEISQGVLQSIFEYQSQICELTGMDVSNASVYDGASAAAEAVFMCEERKKSGVIVSEGVNPQTIETVKTYCEARGVEVAVVPLVDGKTDAAALVAGAEGKASVLVQSPNYFGAIEDLSAIAAAAHEAGLKAIASVNPISLGILKTPAEAGCDVAVGEGQPLGMPLSFGGPYLGFMATTSAMMRKLPGRIVGQTKDDQGNRCFVLTLQAREQHIRREKASSNICSNEALCALTASAYMAIMGPAGLAKAANSSASHAHYLAGELEKVGFKRTNSAEFFNEFLTTCPVDAAKLEAKLAEAGILGGKQIDGNILWCCTELNSKESIDELISVIKEVA